MGIAPNADLWDLLDRLDAAAEDSDAYHHDLCAQGAPGKPCSCGAGRLFIDAAAFIRGIVVEQAVTQAQQSA